MRVIFVVVAAILATATIGCSKNVSKSADKPVNQDPVEVLQTIPVYSPFPSISGTPDDEVCEVGPDGLNCLKHALSIFPKAIRPQLNQPRSISVGGYQTCALDSDGVKCWFNAGTEEHWREILKRDPSVMVAVPNLKGPTFVNSGNTVSCAIDDDSVKCWGEDEYNILHVPKFRKPRMLAVGMFHACALDQDGVKCWGSDPYKSGSLNIPLLKHPVYIATSTSTEKTCAIDDEGVKCWGGKLDDRYDKPQPKLVNPKMVALDYVNLCALDDEGVKCWGDDFKNNFEVPPLNNPTFVTTGGFYNCAMTDNGTVCWNNGKTIPLK